MTTDIDLVLVPVDGSERAAEALTYGVAVADRYDAAVHVLHVVDEPVMKSVEAGELDAEDVADEQLSVADEVAPLVGDVSPSHSSAVGFSLSRLRQHPGSAILDVAEELPADFVVVPREADADPEQTMGRAAQCVVEYASQPVLSV